MTNEQFQPKDDDLPVTDKVWTSLITNTKYMPGLLTLAYSLSKYSKYPFVALYTDSLEPEGHKALDDRGIYKKKIEYLLPSAHKDYTNDARFYDCWSKLQPFSLTEFSRVVQLDSDMVVVQDMDELMELELSPAAFAATHACVCNPYKKPHYPKDWHEDNCAYTHYHPINSDKPDSHIYGPSAGFGLGICNGGLQIVDPSFASYKRILDALNSPSRTDNYEFADQSLLSDIFKDEWIPLSYKYNALKTLKKFHEPIWDDKEVKNIHYILTLKPWDIREKPNREELDDTGTFKFWFELDDERLQKEKDLGIDDDF